MYYNYMYIYNIKLKNYIMNTFSITFKSEQNLRTTIDINSNLHSVQSVKEWFEDIIGKTALSITKH